MYFVNNIYSTEKKRQVVFCIINILNHCIKYLKKKMNKLKKAKQNTKKMMPGNELRILCLN